MNRRSWLRRSAAATLLPLARSTAGASSDFPGARSATLEALADAVLPESLSAERRRAAVAEFVAWVRAYRPGADLDSGYGFTKLRKAPSSPASTYSGQLAALDAAARRKGGAFAKRSLSDRRAIVERALAAAKIDALPEAPEGRHVAIDLMSFFFGSAEANDLCYQAAIGRETCRGLPDSWEKPPGLADS